MCRLCLSSPREVTNFTSASDILFVWAKHISKKSKVSKELRNSVCAFLLVSVEHMQKELGQNIQ